MEIEGIQEPIEQEEPVIEEQVVEEPQSEPEESEPQAEIEEKYEPNYGYKYKDEEFEFDERLRGLVKDKDSEQFVRDLVTAQKAIGEYKEVGGIREIQEKLSQYDDFNEKATQYTELNSEIDQLSGMLALNNTAGFEAFRKHLGINKEQVINWAIEEAKGMQDPDAMKQIEAQRQLHEENFNLQYQNQQMHNSNEAQIVQQRTAELESILGNNDVAQQFDNLVGTPGSFKQEVINHGANVYHQSNGQTILSIPEAVMAVQQKYQGLVANQNSGTNTQVAQNPEQSMPVKTDPQQTVVIRQEGKNVIPSLDASNASPAKKKITNLSDMRAAAKAMDN